MYLIEHLLLSMRELSFYANKYFESKIDDDMKSKMENIKNVRNAICHRSSEKNWLSGNIKIQGSLLFRTADVEIQYGKHRIYLIEGVIDLYRKFREAFFDPKSAFQIRSNPYGQEIEETELKTAIEKLIESIKQFEEGVLGVWHSPL